MKIKSNPVEIMQFCFCEFYSASAYLVSSIQKPPVLKSDQRSWFSHAVAGYPQQIVT